MVTYIYIYFFPISIFPILSQTLRHKTLRDKTLRHLLDAKETFHVSLLDILCCLGLYNLYNLSENIIFSNYY